MQPIDPSTIPNWKQLTPQLIKGPEPLRRRQALRRAVAVGPERADVEHGQVQAGVTNSWSALYDPANKGLITIPNNPIQIADAALYLSKTKPALGIKDPVRADVGPARRGGRPAQVAAPADQEAYWGFATDEVKIFQTGGATVGAAWPLAVAPAPARGREGLPGAARRKARPAGRTSGCSAKNPKNPELRRRPGSSTRRARRCRPQVAKFDDLHAGQPPVLQGARRLGSASRYHADGDKAYLNKIKFWKTPLSNCGERQDQLRALRHVGQRSGRRSRADRRPLTSRRRRRARSRGSPPSSSATAGSSCCCCWPCRWRGSPASTWRRSASLFVQSFWRADELSPDPIHVWNLDNYRSFITGDSVYRSIVGRTLGFAAVTTLIDIALAFPLAYYLARVASPRMRRIVLVLVTVPLWSRA